jgi:hypothetical protein
MRSVQHTETLHAPYKSRHDLMQTRETSGMSTDIGNGSDDSEVFLVRLWTGEVAGSDEAEAEGASMERDGVRVQGKVTHLMSGEASRFGDLPTLVNLLLRMMPPTRDDEVAGSE